MEIDNDIKTRNTELNTDERIRRFEKASGYIFQNKQLLIIALTHSSYANELRVNKRECNERLEFLGDAVLEVISSDYIFRKYPDKNEGDMSRLRASYVCEPTLALCARMIHLDDIIYLGKGEEMTGGRKRDSIVSDALEATIGAIFIDGGIQEAKKYVDRVVLDDIENKFLFYDSKTHLQMLVQEESENTLEYRFISEEGPAHNRTYTYSAVVNGKEISRGTGSTKKKAEQEAAYKALLILRKQTK
ncbi:MAG: ribonuclease III [Lachnospiraceae bacterium]|jgi:ribonuclease-3|nr:ribonuclease III [Lachnospiraceae bacterium]MEE3460392.1 ribonuclease III [Lachnospiraceae bacterium]